MAAPAPSPRPPDRPLVRLEGISKHFGAVAANADITLDIHPGKVLALLGENGAGKSTLMAILSGRFRPDAGRILVRDEPADFASPRQAIAAGIGMVYQHFMLAPRLTVAENVLLGQEGGFFLSPRKMRAKVAALAEEYGLALDPAARVEDLSMGERQRVEILKLLHRRSRVLIFDEPTAVLTPGETSQLFAAFRALVARDRAVVFISHKLEEVLEVADEVAILRRGRVVETLPRERATSGRDLASRMVGREVLLTVDKASLPPGEEVLRVEGLSGDGLSDVSLSLRQGEVLAVVGVAGNGQKPLAEILAGLVPPREGKVLLLGQDWKEFYSRPSWRGSLCYIPEDRLGLATMPGMDVVDNVLLTTRRGFARGPLLDLGRARTVVRELVEEYNVHPRDPNALAWQLSGGNLQKLVLAREFYRDPRIILAEQPTQGLDVAATEEVWGRLLLARRTAGVLLVTGDLNEALQLADRVAVMFRGRIMDTFPVTDRDRVSAMGPLMAGMKTAAAVA
ncbi:MAG: ABC transporter ATP-binding protein [Thermodesulfobacteriota bacterium]